MLSAKEYDEEGKVMVPQLGGLVGMWIPPMHDPKYSSDASALGRQPQPYQRILVIQGGTVSQNSRDTFRNPHEN